MSVKNIKKVLPKGGGRRGAKKEHKLEPMTREGKTKKKFVVVIVLHFMCEYNHY